MQHVVLCTAAQVAVCCLQDPVSAVAKACQWRAAVLAALCSDSLGAVAEALKEKGPPRSWQFKQHHAGVNSKYGISNW
jgi:hypothetical protein